MLSKVLTAIAIGISRLESARVCAQGGRTSAGSGRSTGCAPVHTDGGPPETGESFGAYPAAL
eukprot:scaffold529_cov308-Pinguiococcus_pyrenoidosus.AAC.56